MKNSAAEVQAPEAVYAEDVQQEGAADEQDVDFHVQVPLQDADAQVSDQSERRLKRLVKGIHIIKTKPIQQAVHQSQMFINLFRP